ncbi:ABC transporter substrate-binding protein [Gulosibacter molinativorax]|uniref:Glycine/betaine ABC transporter n=1 Tax=Gulosibacter molinativorax TaxID=256821 RepID=A0ABT7C559_9MICO|nr:ABC transporter substrate-binding protein [Gulosibacter molinativorax]MDJ1370327.1 glycine/betaine ABC transporter [Gulosibacter molinativorax]QUY61239.1 Putative osmoprotectant uptake system substrate-binding protein OsmF [Gulosibacter molinativorax]
MSRFLRTASATLATAGLIALAGCASADPLSTSETDAESSSGDSIVIGSQDYYSNEIIAEIYAQALEAEGLTVDRQFRIGQREAYLPEIEAGSIDLFPEYSGPLLQYWGGEADASTSEDVYAELQATVPEGLRVLDQSPATDQDSYVVTQEFADEWDLETIADLANVTEPLTLGANSEAETRPNGPIGLKEVYGVDAEFTPIEDGGGPLTVQALKDGDIQLAIIYTADPSIAQNGLVSLEDPEGLFLASHVVPLASENVSDEAAAIIDEISAAMVPEDLIGLNVRSVEEELPAADIAADWLTEKGLV